MPWALICIVGLNGLSDPMEGTELNADLGRFS